jgi:hypothetical protein
MWLDGLGWYHDLKRPTTSTNLSQPAGWNEVAAELCSAERNCGAKHSRIR